MQLSVIVVTHDSSRWLPGLGASWRAAAGGANFTDWEIMVVDAASKDDTQAVAERELPGAKILTTGNIGYGAAANCGVAQARGSWVMICNPDLTFQPRFVEKFLQPILEGHDRDNVGCFAPRLLNGDGSVQASVGRFFTLNGMLRDQFRPREQRKYLWPQPLAAQHVDWATGACLVVQRDVFLSIGGFDEKYFLYVEEVDLQRRLFAQGRRTRFLPIDEAGVIHHQPNAGRPPRREVQRWAARGNLRYFAKFGGGLPGYRLLALLTRRLTWQEATASRSKILGQATGP